MRKDLENDGSRVWATKTLAVMNAWLGWLATVLDLARSDVSAYRLSTT